MIFSYFSSLMSTYNLSEEYKKPWQNDASVLCFYFWNILKVVFPKEFHINWVLFVSPFKENKYTNKKKIKDLNKLHYSVKSPALNRIGLSCNQSPLKRAHSLPSRSHSNVALVLKFSQHLKCLLTPFLWNLKPAGNFISEVCLCGCFNSNVVSHKKILLSTFDKKKYSLIFDNNFL